jgi:thiamine biosynthesis lipoprotein
MTSVDKFLPLLEKSHFCKWLFCLLLVVSLGGCSGDVEPVQLSGATMGTTWHISYIKPKVIPDQDQLQSGVEEILETVNQRMSTYLAESEISQFNAAEANTWFTVSSDVFTVLSTALDVGRQSEGAYDVTVAPLVELWGFGSSGVVSHPPKELEITALMRQIGQGNLRLDDTNSSILKQRDLSLDFSSLAKGYAVDRLADWMISKGVDRFMIEVGGELRLSGLSGRGDFWRIAIEQPEAPGGSVAATMDLTDVAVATSGDYRNYFEADGQRYSHMIDPRSGYPIAHDLVSVTVVHQNCMIADAWATALTVLGSERALAVAQAQGLAVYFIRRVGDDFEHSHTSLFSDFLAPPGSL